MCGKWERITDIHIDIPEDIIFRLEVDVRQLNRAKKVSSMNAEAAGDDEEVSSKDDEDVGDEAEATGQGDLLTKACFFVGNWAVRGQPKGIWVTSSHGGVEVGMTVGMCNKEYAGKGEVIFVDAKSDVAVIAGENTSCHNPALASGEYESVRVVVAGVGEQNSGLSRVDCRIQAVDPLPPILGEDKSKWKPWRFFLLDQAPDARFSGAPVFDGTERAVGMLCADGWVLKCDFIVEALADCIERPGKKKVVVKSLKK
jgi:hypothetical protein